MSSASLTQGPRAPLLLCASSSRTGPAEGQIALARFLRGRGIDARVAADTVKAGDIAAQLEAAQVPFVRGLRLSRSVRPADVVADVRHLRGWLRSGAPDLLHASFAHDHAICLWAARKIGAAADSLRLVRTAHRASDVTAGALGWRRRMLARTDGVVVHSTSYRRRLLGLGLDPARVLALPGSVDAQRFSPGRAPEWRRELGIDEEAPLVGIVARMKPGRGHEALLRALVRVSEQLPAARLVLVGRGEHEQHLRELLAELHLGGCVVFGGYRTGAGLVAAYRALDVAVWLREGNDGACRGVLEAMACGVPLVAGDEGAPAELVAPADAELCGRVVNPDDPAALAAALLELLADLPKARRLGEAARLRAASLTPALSGAAMLAFYCALRELPAIVSRA